MLHAQTCTEIAGSTRLCVRERLAHVMIYQSIIHGGFLSLPPLLIQELLDDEVHLGMPLALTLVFTDCTSF